MNDKSYRVRFAPSPTGNPHVGNFRTALYNYLFARHHGGAFLLRIEDTDKERSKPEYEEAILDSLRWMGMEYDEDPIRQSARIERHIAEANRLLAEGKAYRCRCTPEEVDARRKEQMAAGQNPMYDGRCRDANHPDDGAPFCIRLKTPREGVTTIHDPIRGNVAVQNNELDDLIIVRTDGSPTYNFAVVVDDYDMKITHVIRGDDHLKNGARQAIIYQALGCPQPVFAHLPQILGEDKTRLSKRHGATGVLEYREQGYLPQTLINYLARLGWGHGDQEFFTKDELIELFELENVNKSSAVFDPKKLEWLNGEHIRALSVDELTNHFTGHIHRKCYLTQDEVDKAKESGLLEKCAACTQVRSSTLDEMFDFVRFVFQDSVTYPEKPARKTFKPDAMQAVEDLAQYAAGCGAKAPSDEEWEAKFNEIMETRGLKMRALAGAVRLGLTGSTISPPIFDILNLLGPERVAQRLREAVEFSKTIC